MWDSWGLVFPGGGVVALLALFLAMRSLCSRRSGGSSTLSRYASQPDGACHYRGGMA
jgi:hypothetical protein